LKILLIGTAGQLGWELARALAPLGEVRGVDRHALDLADVAAIATAVRNLRPQLIVNAAAYTAVDRAESEADLAMAVNAKAPEVLAEEAKRIGALLVHYSTDYVFDGTKSGAWEETDAPNPLSVYGASKLAGEQAIAAAGGRYLIFRTSWVYGPHGKNFLLTMLRLGHERDRLNVVDDQIGAPTTSIELADATRTIVDGVIASRFGPPEAWAGIYHMTCGGVISWCGFAKAIFERAQPILNGKIAQVSPIPTSAYPTPARRPLNSVLSNEKLFSRFGVRLREWEPALDAVMHRLGEDALDG